jgi:diguanylate cyclase (GGDEF)-like protein/PAS domain S-box-containing protein
LSKLFEFFVHSIRGRIIAGVVLLHALLMGLIVADMVSRQQSFMQNQLARQGESLARTLAVSAPSWLISNDVNGLAELVASLKPAPNLQLALILDRDGRVRASTDPSLFNLQLTDSASRTLIDGGVRQLWHEDLVDSVAVILAGGQPIGYARVVLNSVPVKTELVAVTRKGVTYILFAILFGGLVAWLVVHSMTRRLARLSAAADRIATGDLESVVVDDHGGRDEVSRLAHDFSQMTAALIQDRQRRDEAETLLFAEKERAQVTLASIGDAVITTDVVGHIHFLNGVAEDLTGWNNEEAFGLPLDRVFRIINEMTRAPAVSPVEVVLRKGIIVGLANHTILMRRDGSELNIEDSAAPIRDRDGHMIGVVLVFHDVTKAHEMARQMSWAATHDSLTGLHNRAEFERRLQSLATHDASSSKRHALLYIDLDQFKVINDTCGHAAGDQMLCQISALMQSRMRESDTLARLGGDEFGILLENCPLENATRIAEGILESIGGFRFAWQEKTFVIGASIGLVEIAGNDLAPVALLAAADTACYAAKDEGRNRIRSFSASDSELIRRSGEMNWVARINRAFDETRFRLHWQPILPLNEARASDTHGEILLRMEDDQGVLVLPGHFLPAAERYNLMPRIDRWVIEQSLRWLVDHPHETLCGSINLSGQSLGDERFLEYVVGQLQHVGIAPARVCFEITETAAISNLPRAIRFISTLRERGCRFSLDDFGTGLSSFGYLKNLPVDYLKIDGAFIRNFLHNPIDQAMVVAINNIGHVMGLLTIAEFVESEEVSDLLRTHGVDFAQGFGLARPVPIEEVYSPR